jgi:DNA-binding NarL/FixJ family response regulator
MDCSMPGGDGLTATKEITTTYPETSVVILSMHSGDTWVRRAIEAGARGYILKNAELDLVSMIRRVVIGEIVLDQRIPEGSAMHAKRSCGLTARELQVLQLIVEGKSTIEIASLLEVSVNTVSVHRTRISRSLNCHTTAELVSFAIRNGLVNVP